MKRKAAILDFDDTLLATFQNRSSLIIDVAKEYNYNLTLEIVKQHWGKPFRQLISDMMPGIKFDEFHSTYSQAMLRTKPQIHKGADLLLQYLSNRQFLICIVSSSSHSLIMQDLASVGLDKYADNIWGYEDTKHYKPDPRSLEPVISHINNLGIAPKFCFSIGDSPNDYMVASGNSIIFFAVTTGRNGHEDFQKLGLEKHLIFSNLPELLSEGSPFLTFAET